MSGRSICGRVVDEDGVAVPEAGVSAFLPGRSFDGEFAAATFADDEGVFELELDGLHTVRLVARHSLGSLALRGRRRDDATYVQARAIVDVRSEAAVVTDVEIVLARYALLRGAVTGLDLDALDARVTLDHLSVDDPNTGGGAYAVVDGNGRFEMTVPVPPGTYEITVDVCDAADGGDEREVMRLRLPLGPGPTEIRLEARGCPPRLR